MKLQKGENPYNWLINGLFKYSTGLLLLFILLSGCKKEIGKFLLGDLKNQNPFNGTETIIYLDNNNDSIVFYSNGRNSYLIESPSQANPRYYYINEVDKCSFVEKNGNFSFLIQLTSHYDRGAAMNLTFTHIVHPDSGTCYSYTNHHYILPLIENYQYTNQYIDKLHIFNKYYNDVFVDSALLYGGTYDYGCDNRYKVSALFYTTTYGLIKIDFEDGNSWQLESIEW